MCLVVYGQFAILKEQTCYRYGAQLDWQISKDMNTSAITLGT